MSWLVKQSEHSSYAPHGPPDGTVPLTVTIPFVPTSPRRLNGALSRVVAFCLAGLLLVQYVPLRPNAHGSGHRCTETMCVCDADRCPHHRQGHSGMESHEHGTPAPAVSGRDSMHHEAEPGNDLDCLVMSPCGLSDPGPPGVLVLSKHLHAMTTSPAPLRPSAALLVTWRTEGAPLRLADRLFRPPRA